MDNSTVIAFNLTNILNGAEKEDYTTSDIISAVYYFVMFCLIVPLNVFIIVTLVTKERRKSRLHFFILHLAIADLLVGLINVLGDGIVSSSFGVWYGGDVLCRIWKYLKIVAIIASNDLLIGLSIDRFLAIAFPMTVMKRGSILYKGFVVGAWAVGLVFSLFFLLYSKTVANECKLDLDDKWWQIFMYSAVTAARIWIQYFLLHPYMVIIMLAVYVIPTLIITFCYVTICIVVWRKWRENQGLNELSRPTADGQKQVETTNGLLSKAKVKSIKITLVICLAFFLCWTPYFVINLVLVFDGTISAATYTVLGGLYCLNSLCNPLVFMLFNRDKFLPRQICGVSKPCDSSTAGEEQVTMESLE